MIRISSLAANAMNKSKKSMINTHIFQLIYGDTHGNGQQQVSAGREIRTDLVQHRLDHGRFNGQQ